MKREPYEFTPLGLGAYLVHTDAFEDHRGYVTEGYNRRFFAKNGIRPGQFIQWNLSQSKKGVLRGMHYQKDPYGQARLIRCLSGEVFDAAVDVRKGSKTFGQYVSATISAKSKLAVYLPGGFANGFVVLSDEDAVMAYLVDKYFAPNHATGLAYDDPDVGIKWPVKPRIISEKDKSLPSLKQIRDSYG